MFTLKRKWFHASQIVSDEGFSVAVVGRDRLVYREGERSMSVTVDAGAKAYDIFVISIGRWDDDPADSVSEQQRVRIAERIRRALESQGNQVSLL